MILVLTGANDFARRYELRQLTDNFIKKYGDFGLEKIDASEVEYGRLLEGVASLPFLADRRMIVLSNLSSNKSIIEDVNKLIDGVSETTDLIIDETKFDKRLSLYKVLKKRVDIKEFKELDERSLSNWLVSEAKARGAKLSSSDANSIIMRAGINQMSLSNELDKLINYDPNINKYSIEELVYPIPSSSIFELVDATFSGNKKKAMEIYKDQRVQRVEPQAILGMISWQLHVIAVVKFNEEEDAEKIASNSKINPYVVRKTKNLVSRLSHNKVRKLVSRATDLDMRLKTQPIDADEAIQNFILTI